MTGASQRRRQRQRACTTQAYTTHTDDHRGRTPPPSTTATWSLLSARQAKTPTVIGHCMQDLDNSHRIPCSTSSRSPLSTDLVLSWSLVLLVIARCVPKIARNMNFFLTRALQHPSDTIVPGKPRSACVPLPSQLEEEYSWAGPSALHPVLEYRGNEKEPILEVDLSRPSATIIEPPSWRGCLDAPATYPALPSLTVSCSGLPWPIVVHAASNGHFVTVHDVFSTIHWVLQEPVPGGNKKPIGLWGDERTLDGLLRRRIDWLERRVIFMGLVASQGEGETWEMYVR